MLDRIQEFKEVAAKNGISIDLSQRLSEAEQAENKDRELIDQFLVYTQDTQRMLIMCDQNNANMKQIANK